MLHKKSNVLGRVPSASTLGFGEIAVNYNEKEPFLAIKTSGETNNFEVVKISSDKIIEQKINDAVDKVGSELNELADIVSQNELVTADSLTELNDTINYVDSKFSDYATSADTSSTIKAVSAATSAAIKAVNDKADALSDTVVKTTPQTLSNNAKNQVKANLGISNPDWTAQEGEEGHIENKPFEETYILKVTSAGTYTYKGNGNYTYRVKWVNNHTHGNIEELKTDGSIITVNVFGALGQRPVTIQYTGYNSTLVITDQYNALDEEHYIMFGVSITQIPEYFIPDTVIKTTPQVLSDTDKNQVKENLGISNPDWDAKAGEAGYIKNRSHYRVLPDFIPLVYTNQYIETYNTGDEVYSYGYKIKLHPGYNVYTCYLDYVGDLNSENFTELSVDLYTRIKYFGYGGWPDEMPDGNDWFDAPCLIVETEFDNINECFDYLNQEFLFSESYVYYKQLDAEYLPNTVLKTTPQTLIDVDKNQVLTNLGLTDIAKKSELDKIYSSAVTYTGRQIEQFHHSGVLYLKYEHSDNTVYYKGLNGGDEWAALPIWILNMYIYYTLGGAITITSNMVISSGGTIPRVINDFKIYADESNGSQTSLSWNCDGKKYILTFDGNGPQGQNIVVEQSLEVIVEENEEIVSSALNSLNDDIKQIYKIIEEGDGGVGNSIAIEAVSQVATDLYNFKNEVRTGITVYNSERIAGQTIDEIVAQIGGGSNGGGINPEYDSGSRAYVVGVDDDGNAYYSDVYMSGNTLNAPNGFFQQSDENLKTFISNIEVDLEKITQLPKKYFMWSDKRDENIHIGTSAQAVQELYPEIVKRDKNGNLTVDYSKLSVIALRAIDVLNEERKQMKADIAEIKTKLGL